MSRLTEAVVSPQVWRAVRDIVLFCAGLAGVAHETLVAGSADPSLLVLYAAMMGLPAFLRKDEGGN